MKNIALLFCFCLLSTTLSAQQRFTGGLFAGVNLAQVDGDFQQGYNKTMFGGGIRAAMIINRKFDIGTELMYNGKGAEPSGSDKSSRNPNFYMTMHYAEAALTANLHFDQNEEGYNKKTVQIGVSYGRLLSSSNEISKLTQVDTLKSKQFSQENIKNVDISLLLGFAYRFTPKIGIAIRHTYSMTPFFEKIIVSTPRVTPNPKDYFIGRSYFLSFHIFYDLWTPELRKPKKAKKNNPKK
jgi:hypothetical protein